MTITTIIFDVDDTLYDVATGFTESRNGDVVQAFMVDVLGFADMQSAKTVRDEYFDRYHATAKALLVAQQEGKFPTHARRFDPLELADYWADHLDYTKLGGAKAATVVRDLSELASSSGLQLVAFSNGPRRYVEKVLVELGLWQTVFTETTLFAVDDVLPHCKPEAAAFQVLFDRVGVTDPSTQCIMVEDSMKNIRQAKRLGLKTVLVYGSNYDKACHQATPGIIKSNGGNNDHHQNDDRPNADDPAVDVAMPRIEDFRRTVPGLWQNPVSFP